MCKSLKNADITADNQIRSGIGDAEGTTGVSSGETWGSVRGERVNFQTLILGCIESSFSNKILILSTFRELLYFHTSVPFLQPFHLGFGRREQAVGKRDIEVQQQRERHSSCAPNTCDPKEVFHPALNGPRSK